MKLKSLGPIAGDSSRCKLVFDDGTVIKTLTSVAAGHGLYPGIVLEGAAWQAFLDDVEAAGARLRAVRIVSAAAVSEKELRRRLVRKGESQQNADAAADWLKDIGALDDGELAGRIARRAAAKGYGKARIRQELAQKGVPKEFWDAALDALPEPDRAIDQFIEQKLRGGRPDRAQQQKLIDALRRRGHSWGDIRAALARYELALEDGGWDNENDESEL